MRYETLAILLICAVGFGGLGYLFVSLTDGVNQPVVAPAKTERVVSQAPVAPPANTLEQQGWREVGGPSILANADDSELLIKFNTCDAGDASVELPSGPLTVTLYGLTGNDCDMSYGIGDGNAICIVPSSVGQLRFAATANPNFAVIDRYCE